MAPVKSGMPDTAIHDAVYATVRKEKLRAVLSLYGVHPEEIERLSRVINTGAKLEIITTSLRGHMRENLKIALRDTIFSEYYEYYGIILACQAVMGTEILHPKFEPLRKQIEPYESEFSEILAEMFDQRWGTQRNVIHLTTARHLKIGLKDRSYSRDSEVDVRTLKNQAVFWQQCLRRLTDDKIAGKTEYVRGLTFDMDVGGLIILSSELTEQVTATKPITITTSTEPAKPRKRWFSK